MIYESKHSSNANEVRDLPVAFRAQAFDDDDVLRASERAVFAAIFENAVGNSLSHIGQARQFFDRRGVEVNASVGLCLHGQKQKAKGKAQKAKVGSGMPCCFI